MHRVHQQQQLPFAPEQLYRLVGDIECYPDFLPWCQQVRILRHKEDSCDARVVVGFKGLRQSYHCRVTSDPDTHTIDVAYLSGPLADLETRWQFSAIENAAQPACMVDFKLEFSFRSSLFSGIMRTVMLNAVEHMTDAFVHRAHTLYSV